MLLRRRERRSSQSLAAMGQEASPKPAPAPTARCRAIVIAGVAKWGWLRSSPRRPASPAGRDGGLAPRIDAHPSRRKDAPTTPQHRPNAVWNVSTERRWARARELELGVAEDGARLLADVSFPNLPAVHVSPMRGLTTCMIGAARF